MELLGVLVLGLVGGGGAVTTAVCRFDAHHSPHLHGNRVSGEIRMSGDLVQTWMEGEVSGLAVGPHGFHVHESGDMADHCKASGGHFNPSGARHGAPDTAERHAGDLGNILTAKTGRTKIRVNDKLALLEGPNSIIGRAIVIHTGEDDLGLGGDSGSASTGNAGSRAACCLVRRTEEEPQQPVFTLKKFMAMLFPSY